MSTAEATAPANGTAATQATKSRKAPAGRPLNPDHPLGIPCQVIGGTGEKWSGKTIFGYSLAPGVHPEGHPFAGQPRTLMYDLEMSGSTYSTPGVERIDVPSMLREKFGDKQITQLDLFLWWKDQLKSIKPRQYDVIMVDPATDLEAGLVDYVRANPADFGYTAGQFANSVALLMDAVKKAWKLLLLGDVAARCKVFYFTTHLRTPFENGKPVKGKREAKGKDTLYEVTSLYLWFEREKGRENEKPRPPSAKIEKDRLCYQEINADGDLDIISILPERLPEATPKAIKHYVQFPVGLRKLKAEELVHEKSLTDDERKYLELEIATQNATAAQASLSVQERIAKAKEQADARAATMAASQAAGVVARQAAGLPTQTAGRAELDEPIDQPRMDSIIKALETLHGEGNVDAYRADIQRHSGSHSVATLTKGAADGYLAGLYGRISAAKHAAAQAKLAASGTKPEGAAIGVSAASGVAGNTIPQGPATEVAAVGRPAPQLTVAPARPGVTDETVFDKPDLASAAQIAHIYELLEALQIPIEDVHAWHRRRKVNAFQSYAADDMADLIGKLEGMVRERDAEAAAAQSAGGGERGASGEVYPPGN